MALVLNSKEFARYHARLAANFKPTLLRGVRSGAARSIPYLVDRTRTAPPANPAGIGTGGAVNTGALARGWRWVATPEGADILNPEPHGPVVDGGRRPGKFPPKDALVAWIKRRLLTSEPPRRRRRVQGPRTASDRERAEADKQRRLRSAIQRAVAGDDARPQRPERPDREPAKRSSRSQMTDAQAERKYFPIARAIARRGLLPRRILRADEPRRRILDFVRQETIHEINREQAKR